jgi:hypothetical protein
MSIRSNAAVIHTSANVATVLFAVVVVLQILLALGILPISMAWGGRQSVLTPMLRLASLASALVLGLFAYVIRRRAGLAGPADVSVLVRVLAWAATAYMAFNTVANLASQTRAERLVFTPITLVLTVVCFIVSISRP